ncbi:MAG: DUF4157 domain-containing protein [Methylobacter sp.]|nr:DUF4157 domain-containing protein [Methylobacter sp.]
MKVAQKQTANDSNRSATEATQSRWQNQLAHIANNSEEAVAQRAFIAGINDSPRMLAQRRCIESYIDADRQQANAAKPNNTGLPDNLKSGIESLSGLSMDNAKVHYNSSQPAQLNALAYAQGNDIHIAPGQEQHLPHEAWHVVQQAQGRVQPTMQMKNGVPVNDDKGLEHEADSMGTKATNAGRAAPPEGFSGAKFGLPHEAAQPSSTVQRVNKNVTALAARRLNQARDAINYTKATIPGAGNQTTALTAGNINPYFRMKVMRNEQPPAMYGHVYPAPPYWSFTSAAARTLAGNNPADYVKARARLAHGGNCGEHADVAYSYLRVNAVGEKIAKCSINGLDHAFVLIGDLRTWIGDSDSEIAVADPWPTQAKATLWEDHFAYTSWHMDINQNRSMVADGQDVEPLISAGLQLTPEGQQVIAETLPAADTAHFVGNVGHLWTHPRASAAGKEFDHLDPTGAAAGN